MTAGSAVGAGGTEGFGAGVLGVLLNILQLGTLGLRMLETLWLGLVYILGLHSVCIINFYTSPPLCALLHFCRWGNVVPMSIFLWPAWASPWCEGLL